MSERINPFRVSITGIDGAGKDTIALNALTRLSEDGLSIAKVSRPYYKIKDGKVEEVHVGLKKVSDWIHHHADESRNRRVIGSVNALNTLLQSRIIEPLAANSLPTPDIIASARDLRVDPAVYSGYYFPENKRTSSAADLAERMAGITGVKRDMIVWLQVDPEVAVERIEARIEKEARAMAANGGNPETMRRKWRHMHEDADSLAELASRYGEAIERVVEMQPETEVVPIETTRISAEAVSLLAYNSISEAISRRRSYAEEAQALPEAA